MPLTPLAGRPWSASTLAAATAPLQPGSAQAVRVQAPLHGAEVAGAIGAVVAVYGGALCVIHWLASSDASDAEVPGFWGTLPSAWDHPEPNYVVSAGIGEFWSVLTTIPVAGTLLLYEGVKYNYGSKVLCIYCLACTMYSFAFAAHLTLQKLVFSTTVVSVMTNALLTFAEFSYVVHRWLESKALRTFIVLLAEVVLIATVATLPYSLAENGGVWTLFTVQSPGVFLATGLAAGLACCAKTPKEQATYRIICAAGSLLSTAMVLSLAECLVGFEYGFLRSVWGFPWLHVAIHIFEQVGIYLFGVGVAALHTLVLHPTLRPEAELRCVGRCLVYLYCPAAREGQREASTVSAQGIAAGVQAEKAAPTPTPAATANGGPVPVVAADDDTLQRGRSAAPQEPGLMRQRRIRSPGVVAPKPQD